MDADPFEDQDWVQVGRLALQIGTTVAKRRRKLAMSREELAAASGLSRTILGRIERGDGNPSLETLWKLAKALDVPLGALLEPATRPRVRRLPARATEGLTDPSGLTAWLVHADARERRTELFDLDLPKGTSRESQGHLPGTEEVVVCVAGTLVVGPATEEQTLQPGDAVWFAADAPHSYKAPEHDARALNWLLYPPATG